ncbi:MAG: hypothetical protein JXR94_12285, partial [Candidatus Hydrogenedentes bacterium]|nr:hypothetical protein [Candidatus Hydrogenedentota bacterium]
VKADALQGQGYIEMWCTFGDSSYFSRALHQTVSGDTGWQSCSTPFLLQPDTPQLDRVQLGVRLEGPGTIRIGEARLIRRPLGASASLGKLGALLGLVFGGIGGLFGIVAGFFPARGRCRALVMGVWGVALAASIAALVGGLVLMAAGSGSPAAYPLILVGIIGCVLYPPLYLVVRRQYEAAEVRRMSAMDLTTSNDG